MEDVESQIKQLAREIEALQDRVATAVKSKQTAVQVQAQIDAAISCKVYAAFFTQSGTDAPVAEVLLNTLGGTGPIDFHFINSGLYSMTRVGAFRAGKVPTISGFIGAANQESVYEVRRDDDDTILIETKTKPGGSPSDELLNSTYIEIPVYL